MWTIDREEQIFELERTRVLVGTYVDRKYNSEKIDWLLDASMGFDRHAQSYWHLLIPVQKGYGVDAYVSANEYGVELAAQIINRLDIGYGSLPAIVFRVSGDDFYYVKLGGKTRDQFCDEIGLITDVAVKCHNDGPQDPEEYRDYVNAEVIRHLRKRRILSFAKSAIPGITKLIGGAI